MLDGISHIWLILSGKGGVGKSSVTTQLAVTLAERGFKVGVLDVDLTGPSAPRMFGVEHKKVHQSSAGWVPVYADAYGKNLAIMSLGFLLADRGDSVVWRGPKKTAMIRQFIKDVVWGDLDYLLIDTPPGTSDEHISVAEELQGTNPDGAILVTTPQDVATADVRKEISFCNKVGFKMLGVVENLNGYVCPHCGDITYIFSSGGGETLAEKYSIPFLGSVPIDPDFLLLIEQQKLSEYKEKSRLYPLFDGFVTKIIEESTSQRMASLSISNGNEGNDRGETDGRETEKENDSVGTSI